jgi:hypothetical protein
MRRPLINQQCITPVLFVSMLVAWLCMPDVAATFAPVYIYMLFFCQRMLFFLQYVYVTHVSKNVTAR